MKHLSFIQGPGKGRTQGFMRCRKPTLPEASAIDSTAKTCNLYIGHLETTLVLLQDSPSEHINMSNLFFC